MLPSILCDSYQILAEVLSPIPHLLSQQAVALYIITIHNDNLGSTHLTVPL